VQDPQDVRKRVADWLGISAERVTVTVTLLGGAFGRKSQVDFVFEAVEVSRRAGIPVKLFWTREDDIRNCYFHAESVHRMEARLGADGLPVAWRMRAAYPSIDWMEVKGLDHPMPWETGMGLTNMPFDVPALSIEACRARVPVRIGWLRSVCNLWHAFALNGFIDEMAAAAGKDPVAYRLAMLGEDRLFAAPNEDPDPFVNFNGTTVDTGRYRRVIEFLAARIRWETPPKPGVFRGFAAHNSFYSYVATAIEIAYDGMHPLRVLRIDTAIDCGRVVNPEGVRKQVEGAAVFGLGAALFGEITVRDGRALQSNFGDYRILRVNECPPMIEAHLVPSEAEPGGAGEPPTPTIAPALAAALFAATGTRHRSMPLRG
jgi:isoquinoline 1-oxidoreductase beta subunit